MKAFRFVDVHSGLRLSNLPRPVLGPEEVLIEVRAAGLCHTDCTITKDETYGLIKKRPITLGHEVAGTIVETGSSISGYEIGEGIACCIQCQPISKQDWSQAVGIGYDGGYAEFAIVGKENITRIPDGVSFAQAAVATDSVATAYHAIVTEGCISSSSTVAVIGLGGLGLAGVQIAALKGGAVYGIDRDATKFDAARTLGASLCAQSLGEISGICFDVVYDFAGAGVTTAAAAKSVRAGGKVVLVGLASSETTLETHDLVTRNITLQGSVGASKSELEDVLQLIAQGQLTPLMKEIPFSDIPKGIEELRMGKINGRVFADPSKVRKDHGDQMV